MQVTSSMVVSSYFESRELQRRALEACRKFLGAKDWAIGDRLNLYDASRRAFGGTVPPQEAVRVFRHIYDELVGPPSAGGWGMGRNASGPLWSPEQTFQTIKVEFLKFSWSGSVTLLSLHEPSTLTVLVSSLEKMRSFKPVADWPTMAVSKLLHFYNAELFPIYDSEVIWRKVLTRFKNEFKESCRISSPPFDFGDTPIFYRNYMRWGSALLTLAHPQFMQVFAEWLEAQPGVELSKRQFDATRLFSTAYEYTIIGAYADSG